MIANHPQLVQNAVLSDESDPICRKNTGQEKRLRKWSRGHQFVVRGGGHIDTWQQVINDMLVLWYYVTWLNIITVTCCMKLFYLWILQVRVTITSVFNPYPMATVTGKRENRTKPTSYISIL